MSSRRLNRQEDPGDVDDAYFAQKVQPSVMKTYYFQLHEQYAENPGMEDGIPMVDIRTTTHTDVLHLEENEILEIEKLAKAYKNAENDRFITTKITDFDPNIKATMSYDELEAMLVNWTE